MGAHQVAVVDVAPDAERAFYSMFAVLQGRTSSTWKLVESVDNADVVVTSNRDLLLRMQRMDGPLSGKRGVVVVDAADTSFHGLAAYVLQHPFRVMQVLAMLDDLGGDAGGCGDITMPPERVVPVRSGMPQWAFAESVRAMWAAPAVAGWWRAQTVDDLEIFVSADLGHVFGRPDVFEKVRDGTTSLTPLVSTVSRQPSAHYESRPLSELLWYSAFHADKTLAPWLDADASWRIRQWPDFGTITPTRMHLRIVAAMSTRACSRHELARDAYVPRTEVDRVLNALSLSNLLIEEGGHGVAESKAATRSPSRGFMHSLIGSLRKSLGMVN